MTYQPLTGLKFTLCLLRPLPPSAVFQKMESGWPAPLIARMTLKSINNLSNQAFGSRADPGFDRVVEIIDRVQRGRALSIRVEHRKGGEAVLFVLRSGLVNDALREDLRPVRELLDLK